VNSFSNKHAIRSVKIVLLERSTIADRPRTFSQPLYWQWSFMMYWQFSYSYV